MSLPEKLLALSIAGQVGLTLFVLCWLGTQRLPLIARGEIAIRDIAVNSDAWPLQAQQVSNSFNNQFQLPVLFFAGALLSLWMSGTGWVEALLGLLFVASRIVHAAIHGTSNSVIPRFQAYLVGLVMLVLFWAVLAVRILISPGN